VPGPGAVGLRAFRHARSVAVLGSVEICNRPAAATSQHRLARLGSADFHPGRIPSARVESRVRNDLTALILRPRLA